MHDYANFCKTMYANDPILLSFMRLKIRKLHEKFHLDRINERREILFMYYSYIIYITYDYDVTMTSKERQRYLK